MQQAISAGLQDHVVTRSTAFGADSTSASRSFPNVKHSRTIRVSVALSFAILALSCGGTVSHDYVSHAQLSMQGEFSTALGPGDRFSIDVFREESLSGEYVVSSRGMVSFPLLGHLEVNGLNCEDVEELVSARLAEGLIHEPSVACRVVEQRSLQILVVGSVNSPRSIAYSDTLTIVEAIALAGGLTASASEERAIVTRRIDGEMREIEVPLRLVMSGRAPNLRLWPNDLVFVPAYRFLQ